MKDKQARSSAGPERFLDTVQIKRPISSEPTIVSIHLNKKSKILQPVISP
jgi:hypothetical protein